jgi:hypothetical protein
LGLFICKKKILHHAMAPSMKGVHELLVNALMKKEILNTRIERNISIERVEEAKDVFTQARCILFNALHLPFDADRERVKMEIEDVIDKINDRNRNIMLEKVNILGNIFENFFS